jgi:hypothetical protein
MVKDKAGIIDPMSRSKNAPYTFKPYTSTFSVKFFKANFPIGENEKCFFVLSTVVFETRTVPPVAWLHSLAATLVVVPWDV